MKKLIATVASVALAAGLGTSTASASTAADPDCTDDGQVCVTFTDTQPGKTTANVTVEGNHKVEIVKHNPRNDRERVVRTFTAAGEHSKTVHFPKAKRWMQVYVVVDDATYPIYGGTRPLAVRAVGMPEDQWPVVKPRPWVSMTQWHRNASVWVHADQPPSTHPTRRGTFYRVQVVRRGHVNTVDRGRVFAGDRDWTRVRLRGQYRKGPKFAIVRVKARGRVIGKRRVSLW